MLFGWIRKKKRHAKLKTVNDYTTFFYILIRTQNYKLNVLRNSCSCLPNESIYCTKLFFTLKHYEGYKR